MKKTTEDIFEKLRPKRIETENIDEKVEETEWPRTEIIAYENNEEKEEQAGEYSSESKIMGLTTIVGCLKKAEDMLGKNRIWQPRNENQRILIEKYHPSLRDIVLNLKEVEAFASRNIGELNQLLADRGYDIRLDPMSDPKAFGVISMLDLLVHWAQEGRKTEIRAYDKNQYPATRMKSNNVRFYSAKGHSEPIVEVMTKSEDRVFMSILDNSLDGFDLYDKAIELSSNKKQKYKGETDLIFPMVDLDTQPDISWILELSTKGKDGFSYFIAQAKQQVKLKINEKGAHLKEATAIGMLRCCARIEQPYVIDRPFLLWFEKPELPYPLFAGYIGTNDWKNPGSLDM